MTPRVDEAATKIARARHARGVELLHSLFGVIVEHDADGNVKLPPPNVWAALNKIAARTELNPAGHGSKTLKRRSKRARLARRARFLQRQTWRAYFEEEKRRTKETA